MVPSRGTLEGVWSQGWGAGAPLQFQMQKQDFPGGRVVKNPPASAGDMVQSLVQEDST